MISFFDVQVYTVTYPFLIVKSHLFILGALVITLSVDVCLTKDTVIIVMQ
jgi:hypothetical protein